ncbi:MAG: hypothetical protein ACOCRK_00730 [bacterium]
MSRDVKIFNSCNHLVNDIVYEPARCPRCYGKGYFFDIYFNSHGKAVMSSGNIKLQQEMLKVILDHKFESPFHPFWGSRAHNLIGSKNLNITKAKLEIIVREALERLKLVQKNENGEWEHMTGEEMLEHIENIEIITLRPTGYHIKVTISNKEGDIFTQSITL